MTEQQNETCRWLIDVTLELASPMHLGTGQDIEDTTSGETSWIAEICLDLEGNPTIPGASFKGALRAFAERTGKLEKLKQVFGEAAGDNTQAGLAEFRYGRCNASTIEKQPHVAIDRVTGTAMDKKLFQTQVVPAETQFKFTIVLHKASRQNVEDLVSLLKAITPEAHFILGARATTGLGQAHIFGQCVVKQFGKDEAAKWLNEASSQNWEASAEIINLTVDQSTSNSNLSSLPIELVFDSPFLVNGGVSKTKDGHDVTIPMMRGDRVVLPGSSFRGRLRSQAERILRTLGINVPQGHDAQPWRKGAPHTDLVSLLFGCAGWRGIVSTSDCVDHKESTLTVHEMVAIDRFTGGGKDGAKFSIQAAECPTLKGTLGFDFKRLKEVSEANYWPALGLLTLLLRDLSEGDIRFGYGVSKGFGHCLASEILNEWNKLLIRKFGEQPAPIKHALEQLRAQAKLIRPKEPTPLASTLSSIEKKEFAPFTPQQSNTGFHNPYHFIPLSKPDVSKWTKPEDLKSSRGHHKYNGLSGRITCTLTTKTPLFIGASRLSEGNATSPAKLEGFKFNNKLAIPATSLRGMISSLFESISSSAFRVLHPQPYSMRKTENHLSAMGRIVTNKSKNGYVLEPLTLPTLDRGQAANFPIPAKWKNISGFADITARLKVYFDDEWAKYPANQRYFMKIDNVSVDRGFISPSNQLRYPNGNVNTRFLIGLGNTNNQRPITLDEFKDLPQNQQSGYVEGRVRSLPTGDRLPSTSPSSPLPQGIKHYVFVPLWKDAPKLEIENAKRQFERLADMALNAMNIKEGEEVNDALLLPYVPAGRTLGSDRNKKTKNQPYGTRLRAGDIVFFDVDTNGKVSEISFSSMWRTGINKSDSLELATTADLLAQCDANLLPLGMGAREPVFSPADLLFGTMEYRPEASNGSKANKEQALALAGRVVIGMGLAEGEVKNDHPVTLKELSSPKPPSPALYFKPLVSDGYVSKANLANDAAKYTLRGRKTYLHTLRNANGSVTLLNDQGSASNNGRLPWASKHHGRPDEGHKRRVEVKPIASGQRFNFHIDFDNLSQVELEQLCATLQPDPLFEHRLGLGKPLGLGSIKIEISSISLVDRQQRYASDSHLSRERHHQKLSSEEATQLAATGMKLVAPTVRRALQLLGNPKAVSAPVHYPQEQGGMLENEHFKWFMANDKSDRHAITGNRQHLKSFSANSTELPTLPRYPKQ